MSQKGGDFLYREWRPPPMARILVAYASRCPVWTAFCWFFRAPKGFSLARSTTDLSACGVIVRQNDPDRFFSTLFAPAARREALFALYAFNNELVRVAEMVSEPMLGEIRLQWWREALNGIEQGTPCRHDVVEALATAWDNGVRRDLLNAMIDARNVDLAPEPPETIDDLAAYGRQTAGCMMEQAVALIDQEREDNGDLFDDAGVAVALCGLLRSTASFAAQGRVMLPRETLESRRLEVRDILRGETNNRISEAVKSVALRAEEHLKRARKGARCLPKAAVPALLPLSFAAHDLVTLRKNGYNPYHRAVQRPGGERQIVALWRAFIGQV